MIESSRRSDYVRGAIVGALFFGIAANVADFARIEREVGPRYAAVTARESSYLGDLVFDYSPTSRGRYHLYFEVRDWAAGAEIWLSPDAGLRREQLVGLSSAGQIFTWDGDHQLGVHEEARIEQRTVATGNDLSAGPFTLAVAPGVVERIVSLQQGNRLFLVDARLLEVPVR